LELPQISLPALRKKGGGEGQKARFAENHTLELAGKGKGKKRDDHCVGGGRKKGEG